MDSTCITLALILVVLIALSAWCSSTETAYSSVNKVRLKSKAEDGNTRAKLALDHLAQYDKLLSCILIANNIVNLTAATLSTILFTKLFPIYGPAISTILLTVLVLIFGEITPKSLAKDQAERVCMSAAPILRVVLLVFTPLHMFFGLFYRLVTRLFHPPKDEGITEEELITMVEEAESEGGLEHHESELIRAAIEFNDMEVEEILTPRVDILAAPDTVSMEELAVLFAESGYSRIPIYHSSIDDIIGLVHEKDFFSARYHNHSDVSSLITPVYYTTGSAQISDLLRRLQHRKTHMAVVVDEYGGTSGLVTMEDLLEEIVGNIQDEYDNDEVEIVPIGENTYVIDGLTGLDDVGDLLHLSFEEEDESESDTLGGFIINRIGRIPSRGDRVVITHQGFRFTVLSVKDRRILKVRAEKLPEGSLSQA